MTRKDLERGASSVEAAILAPTLILLLALVAAVGSAALGEQSVTTAAHSASRAASLATNQDDAAARVSTAFTAELSQQGKKCTSLSVDVDAGAFTTSPGEVAVVHATITCTVPYGSPRKFLQLKPKSPLALRHANRIEEMLPPHDDRRLARQEPGIRLRTGNPGTA